MEQSGYVEGAAPVLSGPGEVYPIRNPSQCSGSREAWAGARLGMAGIHRSRTLGQPEPADLKQIPVGTPVKKAESALGFLRDHAVFCHKTPPFWRTGDR